MDWSTGGDVVSTNVTLYMYDGTDWETIDNGMTDSFGFISIGGVPLGEMSFNSNGYNSRSLLILNDASMMNLAFDIEPKFFIISINGIVLINKR